MNKLDRCKQEIQNIFNNEVKNKYQFNNFWKAFEQSIFFKEFQQAIENYDSIIKYVIKHKGLFSFNVKDWILQKEQENENLKQDLQAKILEIGVLKEKLEKREDDLRELGERY